MNSSYSSKLSKCKIASAARNWRNVVPKTATTIFAVGGRIWLFRRPCNNTFFGLRWCIFSLTPPLFTVLHVNSQMANMLYIKPSYIQEFAYLPWQLWRGSRDKYWQDWRGGGLNHRRIKTEEKERLSLLFGGQNRFNSLTCKQFCTKMIWRKGWINPILHIVLVQFIIVFKSSWWKITSATRNWINSAPQAAAMTFAFSCME